MTGSFLPVPLCVVRPPQISAATIKGSSGWAHVHLLTMSHLNSLSLSALGPSSRKLEQQSQAAWKWPSACVYDLQMTRLGNLSVESGPDSCDLSSTT